MTTRRNRKIKVTQDGRESYSNQSAAGTTEILQNDEDIIDAAVNIDAARMEKSV